VSTLCFSILTPTEGTAQLYWVTNVSANISQKNIEEIERLVTDRVDQEFYLNPTKDYFLSKGFKDIQIIKYQPGVTDNAASSFSELLKFLDVFANADIRLHSGTVRCLNTALEKKRLNPLIEREASDFEIKENPGAKGSAVPLVRSYALHSMKDSELEQLSRTQHLALSLLELKTIQAFYKESDIRDTELEMIAQTWSEHCKHKIFAADIEVHEEGVPVRTVHGLFKTYIRAPTLKMMKNKKWLISVFSDNAGIVRFHEGVDVCVKVETHNSPSALDPYGGALTGILGVNRDILGTGLGAKPIANTNVLCFGFPDEKHALPENLFHPYEVLKGVHHGIQDGGNKSGIPTVNGAICFDDSFIGKPLVFCGTIGVLPPHLSGIPSASKNQRPGDYIVMTGGKVGLDGIHGATSSSLALDEKTPSSMVQIGDPLTQRRVMEFLLAARDLGLYSSVTDNGAGGLSSSVGEMAELTGGARLDLDKVPLKQEGLLPWQILVSESQERMTFSVPREKWLKFKELSNQYSVISTIIGDFTDTGYIQGFYNSEKVLDISLDFLHHGLPPMKLKAEIAPPKPEQFSWKTESPCFSTPDSSLTSLLKALLLHPNQASKEFWIRQYDHEVGAATAGKPLEGTLGKSASNNGGVLDMSVFGGNANSGLSVGSGLNPQISTLCPKLMALMAADEAVRNVVVTGADPDKTALLDNFCWPDPLPGPKNPDAEQKLGYLVSVCESLANFCDTYQMPLISGKDSMKNDFHGVLAGKPIKISVLPTLLVTAISYHPNAEKVIKPHIKPGQKIFLLGHHSQPQYFGVSLLNQRHSINSLPTFDLHKTRELYQTFFSASKALLIDSAHDLSEGGLLVALFESLLFHSSGVDVSYNGKLSDWVSEFPGRFLVSIDPSKEKDFLAHFRNQSVIFLGQANTTGLFRARFNDSDETIDLNQTSHAWRDYSKTLFQERTT